MSEHEKDEKTLQLSSTQRARIECNRQRALLLRTSRLTSHPYGEANNHKKLVSSGGSRLIDSGGGFLIEDEEELFTQADLVEQPGPIIDGSEDICKECHSKFSDSYLLKHFDVLVCDGCRENDGKHKLITKSDSKLTYCLKDCDFDLRPPPLKFIIKKNPHNERWGEMKLYLNEQVLARALEVWGSLENIEAQKEKKVEKKEKIKKQKFQKRIKDLRKAVRTNTWHKDLSKHIHEYESEGETYDEEEDLYEKKCKTCDHVLKYEKM